MCFLNLYIRPIIYTLIFANIITIIQKKQKKFNSVKNTHYIRRT